MDLSLVPQHAAAQHDRLTSPLSSPIKSAFTAWAMPFGGSRRAILSKSHLATTTAADGDATVEASLMASTSRRAAKLKKPKTRYSIAHPPPSTHSRKHKMHIRAKVVLQLQKIVEGSRPMPAYEVVSAAAFALKSGKAVANVCGRKDRIRPEDLLILQGQQYGEDVSSDEEDLSSREIVGVLCRDRTLDGHAKGRFEISLADGSTWEARHHRHLGYEFEALDGGAGPHTKARWIRKGTHQPHLPHHLQHLTKAPSSDSVQSKPDENSKFQFSTIDPSTRRHPVIASMTPAYIEVNDRYTVPKPAKEETSDSEPTLGERTASVASSVQMESCDDSVRKLILITGVWVALREGWSHDFSYSDDVNVSTPNSATSSNLPGSPFMGGLVHSATMPLGIAGSSPLIPGTPTPSTVSTVGSLPSTVASEGPHPGRMQRSLTRVLSMTSNRSPSPRSRRIFHRRNTSTSSAGSDKTTTSKSRSRASSFRSNHTVDPSSAAAATHAAMAPVATGLGIEEHVPEERDGEELTHEITATTEDAEEDDDQPALNPKDAARAAKAGLPSHSRTVSAATVVPVKHHDDHHTPAAATSSFGMARLWDMVDGLKRVSGLA